MAINLGSDASNSGNNWTATNFVSSGNGTAANITSFTSVGTGVWTAPAGVTSVSYLVVGGGGGGKNYQGGGGGGVVTGTLAVTPLTSYTVTVGAGGTANGDGSDSVFSSVTASKGLRGNQTNGFTAAGTSGNGFTGGTGTNSGNPYTGGGGGGASQNGFNNSGSTSGAGGAGVSSSISGSSVGYGGGGGAGCEGSASRGAGATTFGGGNGSGPNSNNGSAGTANTGGGGGGGDGGNTNSGYAGGSGIVIISYILADSISTNDSMVDVPGIPAVTSQPDIGGVQRGNYCTLNPLAKNTRMTIQSANLAVSGDNTSNHQIIYSTFGMTTGKWYWEVVVNHTSTSSVNIVGVQSYTNFADTTYVGANGTGCGWGYTTTVGAFYATNFTTSGTAPALANGTIGIAYDADAGKIWFRNTSGAWIQGNPEIGNNPTGISNNLNPNTPVFPAVSFYNQSSANAWTFNFGQRPFSYIPPVGFKSLNTANLPNPVIKRPSDHFDVKLWTGNGVSNNIGTNPKQLASAVINKSLRFKSSSATSLSRTFTTPTNTKAWTFSAWVKRSKIGSAQSIFISTTGGSGVPQASSYFKSDDTIQIYDYNGSAYTFDVTTTRAFKETSAWYHLVFVYDSAAATALNRLRLYVNGTQITAFSSAAYPALNADTAAFNRVYTHYLSQPNAQSFDGYMADVHFVDGQGLTPASFGTFDANNNWAPIPYAGTYGINGFKLNFNDARSPTTAAYDVSGNANHWTPSTLGGWNTVPTIENAPNVLYYGTPGTYTWTAPAGVTSVTYLVVAGGGGGGDGVPTRTTGAGGGAGGMLTGTLSVTPSTSYTVTVGSGGSAGTSPTNGTNSVFASITSLGGGYGAYGGQNGATGGTGGSGGGTSGPWAGGTTAGGLGTAGQGNNGGVASQFSMSGGGGAGQVGGNSSPGGYGGNGLTNSITGVSVYYAGGGGGSIGGLGGGGRQADNPTSGGAALPGTDGLGGGGGGGSNPTTAAARGGSGVVILSYTNAASYVGNGANSSINNDSVLDAPIDKVDANGNAVGNYVVLNPNYGSTNTIQNGGLQLTGTAAGNTQRIGTLGVSSGKWYYEVSLTLLPSPQDPLVGFSEITSSSLLTNYPGQASTSYSIYTISTNTYLQIVNGNTFTNTATTVAVQGDKIGVALDLDNGKIWFSKNGTFVDSGNPAAGTGAQFIVVPGTYTPAVRTTGQSTTTVLDVNFGQSPFAYTPPTGFKALNTKNMKDVGAYNLPDTFGNFVNTPDLVWIKSRNSVNANILTDSVRGPFNQVFSELNNAGETLTTRVQTFNPNGFTTGPYPDVNNSGTSYVSWNWNRGTVPGFDIVQYSGSGVAKTVAHNLGQAPKFMLVKKTSGIQAWAAWHVGIPATDYLVLNTTAAAATLATMWNSQAPGNYSFSVGTDGNTNTDSASYIAYLWAEVPGFSKISTYTGNGLVDGPFVFTGFRPRFIIFKRNGIGNWVILDTARDTYNLSSTRLFPSDATGTETAATAQMDILSNGFKIRVTGATDAATNNSGDTYVYAAFAESPFKYANAR